jgi:pSer/pThr/pTyr-binding forkhead associated (FHA) protein
MPIFHIQNKDGKIKRLEVEKDEIAIGRLSSSNDVVLPEGIVSKRHARMYVKDEQYYIEDLKSTCGTFVNGFRIEQPRPLDVSDKLYIGDYVVWFEDDDDEEATLDGSL